MPVALFGPSTWKSTWDPGGESVVRFVLTSHGTHSVSLTAAKISDVQVDAHQHRAG